jgi:hypothetical protein
MTLILSKDCTRTLDVAIAEERVRYASERIDFHSFFWDMTVPQLQKVIRREASPTNDFLTRKERIADLFEAQQESPHRLWELLILQVVEATLVKRRQALSPADDPHLDELVVGTFVAALEHIPLSVWHEGAQAYVLRVSRRALARKLREERGGPPRRASRRVVERSDARRARAMAAEGEPVLATTTEVR